ncbi:DNA primase [Porticoccus sp. W117]|uniref:DNA primase n=1 Tax=Porticoccus sp. W117 TaxID=3054777 RepID=UPI0025948257|nr:DNA primase [Porticoccus sp. W117]MDM3870227.1 DNA primase [Porticoccus sp. W117]
MPGKIPQHFLDDLLDRVDIVDVINSRVQLKKTGKNYSACCPFHDEKTPSFTVSPDKQFYYCFGCQASGNAVGFLMDFDRFSFPEAVEQLANYMGMEVPREETTPFEDERAKHKKRLYDTLDKADRFYRQQLRSHRAARNAVDYLKSRGLSGKISAAFGIGFAPPGWDNLLLELGEDAASLRLQVDTGLLIEKPEQNKRYDRFRNRIMFPIRDTRGRTIAFGGRVLGDDKPKYLNSPETPVFHKGRELYGLYEATQNPGELKNVVVVEGYMDVVALAQFGIDNAVATLGTAITGPHLEKLFRYTPEVVFCFDGDRAGRQAAHRALENSLPMMEDGRSARFLFLPEGHDPDSMVREKGAERFRDLLSGAQPLSQFLFATAGEGIDTDTPDGKARLAKNAAPYLNNIPANIFRELMVGELANLTGMNADKLDQLIRTSEPLPEAEPAPKDTTAADIPHMDMGHLEEPPPWDHHDHYEPESPPQATVAPTLNRSGKIQLTAERTAIAILLNHTQLAQQVGDTTALEQSENPETQLLAGLIHYLQKNSDASSHQILGHWLGMHRDGQGTLLAEIAACDAIYPPQHSARDNAAEFQDALNLTQRRAMEALPLEQRVAFLVNKSAPDEHDIKAALRLLPEALRSDLDNEIKQQLNQLIRQKK